MAALIVCVFVALMPVGWPVLRWNMQPGDLIFPVAAGAVLAARPSWRRQWLDAFVVVYLVGSTLSIPGSISPRESALALVKELYLAAVYFVLKAAVPRVGSIRMCRWLCGAAGLLAAASLAGALVFYASGQVWSVVGSPMPLPYVGEVFRTHGTLLAPEFFGNVLTLVLPLAAVLMLDVADGAAWSFVFAALAAAEVLTFSKSLGGAVVALVVFLWPRWRSHPVLRATAAAIAVTLVVLFNVAAIVTVRRVDVQFSKDSRVPPPDSLYGRQDDPAGADRVNVGVSYNPMSYYLVKKVAWRAFAEHPWTGTGLSTFPLVAERAYQEGRLHQAYRRVQAHSLPFGRLSETGVIGAITLAVFLAAMWKTMRQASQVPGDDGAVAWALFAGIVGLLVNSVNVDVMHFRFLWFAVAVAAGIAANGSPRTS